MKRCFTIALLGLLLLLSACGASDKNDGSANPPTDAIVSGEPLQPTATATPAAQVTETPSVTPAEPSGTPTPALPEEKSYEFNVDVSTEEWNKVGRPFDPRQVTSMTVRYREVKDDEEVVFSSYDYRDEHLAAWEKKAESAIAEVRKLYLAGKGEVALRETLTESISFGRNGRIDIYEHVVVGDYNGFVTDNPRASYRVDYWLVGSDLSVRYGILYESSNTDSPDQWWGTQYIHVEPFYSNGASSLGDEDRRYDENRTVHPLTQASVGFTTLTFRDIDGDESNARYYDNSTFYSGIDKNGYGTMIITQMDAYEIETDWPVSLGGKITDARGNVLYQKNTNNWQILTYRLSDIAESFYDRRNKKTTVIAGFDRRVGENEIFSERVNIGNDAVMVSSVDGSLAPDNVKVRMYLEYAGVRVNLDEASVSTLVRYYLDDGNSLDISSYSGEITDTPEGFRESVLYARYYKEDREYAGEFNSQQFLNDNRAMFTKHAEDYETKLAEEYRKSPGTDGGRIAMTEKLLCRHDFGSAATILVYENAVYGAVPKQSGDGTLYHYEVLYYLLMPGELLTEGVLFTYDSSTEEITGREYNYATIRHIFDEDGIGMLNSTKEFVTRTEIVRGHSASSEYAYDADSYTFASYFQIGGRRILDMYSTWGDATDYYRSMGASIADANGTILFKETPGTPENEWEILGRPLSEWLAAMSDDKMELQDVALGDTATLHMRLERGSGYSSGTVVLIVSLETDGYAQTIYENRIAIPDGE
ncbi:MAG: hypothetical protein IKX54_02105 [Lachnospiraceae bacterium]|nr:hypothetical protein [Lachnospiraceae bacterium]